jgi:hypothetical protein
MTGEEALAFVRQHGVVLASGKGGDTNGAERYSEPCDNCRLHERYSSVG